MAPFSEKQRRLFNAAEHDPGIAREHGMSGKEARRLADEANKLAKEGRERQAKSLPAGVIDLAPVLGQPR